MAKSARERYEERLRVSAQLLCSNLHALGLASDEACDYAIGLADLLIAKLEKDLVEGEAAEAKYTIDEPATPGLDRPAAVAGVADPACHFRCVSTRCPKGVGPGEKLCYYENCIERRDP